MKFGDNATYILNKDQVLYYINFALTFILYSFLISLLIIQALKILINY